MPKYGEFTLNVIEQIKMIPFGSAATYSQVACLAGNPRGARQVSRILHSLSETEKLPWHRIVSAGGYIRTPHPVRDLHRHLLQQEGIPFSGEYQADINLCRWDPKGIPD